MPVRYKKMFSPGKWKVEQCASSDGSPCYDIMSELGEVVGCEGIWGREKMLEDATLIGAAPSLVEALIAAEDVLRGAGYPTDFIRKVLADAGVTEESP